jgi:hypothetical protein
MAFNCQLPDGRNVNLMTQQGADIFIGGRNSDFKGFSSNMEQANRLRQNNTAALSNNDKEQLRTIYVMIDVLAMNASVDVFKHISKSELECWFDHAITVIQKLTNDNRWTRTGILEEHDAFVLNACIPMLRHYNPVIIAFQKGFFTVVAVFVAAVQTSSSTVTLPCTDIAETICMITSNARLTLLDPSNPTQWSSNKTFKKYESSGILVQFIRCSTVPQPREDIGLIKTYEELLKCQTLLKSKFKKGEQCGDVVHAILNGTDGHPTKRKQIMTFLTSIAKLADIMQHKREFDNQETGMMNGICRHCNKSEMTAAFQRRLMACSKCHQASYCSKECQKADWKKHKLLCKPATSKDRKRSGASQQSVLNFAQKNYADIMEGLIRCCDKTGLKKEEVLVEVDFSPNEDGNIPALCDPPEFIVNDARGYFEGSRPNEPDWFCKNEDDVLYEKNIDGFTGAIKDNFERMTSYHVLCAVRYPGGFSVYRLQLQPDQGSGHQMFSDQALDAYRSALEDEDFGPLSRIFGEAQMKYFKRRLGMPSEDDMDKVRRMMNSNFGGSFPLRGAGGGSS